MKQHIDVKQWEMLSDEQKEKLIPWAVVKDSKMPEQYAEYCSIGKLMEFIIHFHQMDVYTVNDTWCVQLFDIKDCANDGKDCIYENSRPEFVDVLLECVLWIIDRLIDSYIP